MCGFNFYSRHENEVTERFPELINPLIPEGTIFDGEIVISDEKGRPNFEELMSRFQVRSPKRIPALP